MRTTEQQTKRVLEMRDEALAGRRAAHRKFIAFVPAAACLCMVVAFIAVSLSTGLTFGFASKNESLDNSVNDNKANSGVSQTDYSMPECDVPDGYKYSPVTFDGTKYSSVKTELDGSYVGELLSDCCYTYSGTGIYRKKLNCSIYSVKNISPAFGVAMKYENDDIYYLAFTYDYEPETLGQIYTDLGLSDYLANGSAKIFAITEEGTAAEETEYSVSSEILALLFADSAATPESNYPYPSEEKTEISVKMRNSAIFGTNTMEVSVFSDGHMLFNFCGITLMFKADISAFRAALGNLAETNKAQ